MPPRRRSTPSSNYYKPIQSIKDSITHEQRGLIGIVAPFNIGGRMDSSSIDSKRRMTIPPKIIEKLGLKEGDTIIFEEGEDGSFIIRPGKRKDFLEWFRKLILSQPERTGKPESWSPEKMKRIWKEK